MPPPPAQGIASSFLLAQALKVRRRYAPPCAATPRRSCRPPELAEKREELVIVGGKAYFKLVALAK